MRELRAGSFSISEFYVRRIRRISPAYVTVLLFVLACAPFVWSIADCRSVFRTALYSVLLMGNEFFARSISYFDLNAKSNPFLHLWSLGVEAQFYMLFPLLLCLLWHYQKNIVISMACLAGVSLLGAEGMIYAGDGRQAAFFMFLCRAWELLAGGIVSQMETRNCLTAFNERALVVLSISVIGIAFSLCDDSYAFPNIVALVPVVLSTALLIHLGNSGLIGRLLSSSPFVGLGQMSYSVYLWHWPVFVVSNSAPILRDGFGHTSRVAMIAIMIGVFSYASYRLIELPFRDSRRLTRRRAWATITGSVVIVASVYRLFLHVQPANGMLLSSLNDCELWNSKERRRDPRRSTCSIEDLLGSQNDVLAGCGDTTKTPSFVLWGDSHALALLPGLDQVASQYGRAGLFINLKHSFALQKEIGAYPFDPQRDREPVLRWLELRTDICQLLLANSWSHQIVTQDDIGEAIEICRRLNRIGKKIYVFASIPQPSEWAIGRMDWGLFVPPKLTEVSQISYETTLGMESQLFERLVAESLATVLVTGEAFADGRGYQTQYMGRSLYIDKNHVNVGGALKIMTFFAPIIWSEDQI